MKLSKLACTLFLGASVALGAAGCADMDTNGTGSSSSAASSVGQRHIVAYNNAGSAKNAIRAAGGSVARDLPNHGFLSANLPAAALNGLRNHPAVDYIEVDAKRYPLAAGFPTASSQVSPYGIGMVQADQLTDGAAGNRTLCIIDSGIDGLHSDHAASVLSGKITGTNDSGSGDWDKDENHHGTHVAGTIIGLENAGGVVGVLPGGNLNVHIIKVFDADGWAYSSGLVAALDACTAPGVEANVISMSLGGSRGTRSERVAFANADAAGVLSIAAAGNDGNTRHSYPASYDSVVSVAAVDSAAEHADFSQRTNQVELAAPGVAVLSSVPMNSGAASTLDVAGTAVDSAGMDGSPLASASGALVDCGIGDSTCSGASGQVCLISRGTISFSDKVLACEAGGGIAAIIYNNEPGMLYGTLGGVGTTIPSIGISQADGATLGGQLGATAAVGVTMTSWAYFDGTSMATPHVSAVAALIWSYDTSWTNQDIRDALAATAIDLGAAGRDDSFGHGLIQAKAALDHLTGGACIPSCADQCGTQADDGCGGTCDADEFTCGTCGNDPCACVPDCTNKCGGVSDGCSGTCDATCNACFPIGDSCTSASDCCSNKCKGRSGAKTCK